MAAPTDGVSGAQWDKCWTEYQEHLKKYPADKDTWRIFYAGFQAGMHSMEPAQGS